MNDFAGDGGNRAGRPTTSAGPGGGSTPPARSMPIPRYDAAARFASLDPVGQAVLGEWAVALAASMAAAMVLRTPRFGPEGMPLLRAHAAVTAFLTDGEAFASVAALAWGLPPDAPLARNLSWAGPQRAAVPTLIGRLCRVCGCSEVTPCDDRGQPCGWAEEPADGLDGLCSTCAACLEAEAMADYELPCAVKLPVKGGGEVTIRAGAKLSTLVEALRARDGKDLTFGGGGEP